MRGCPLNTHPGIPKASQGALRSSPQGPLPHLPHLPTAQLFSPTARPENVSCPQVPRSRRDMRQHSPSWAATCPTHTFTHRLPMRLPDPEKQEAQPLPGGTGAPECTSHFLQNHQLLPGEGPPPVSAGSATSPQRARDDLAPSRLITGAPGRSRSTPEPGCSGHQALSKGSETAQGPGGAPDIRAELGPRQKRGRRKADLLSPLEGSQNPDSRRQSPRGHGLEPVLLVGQQHPTDILRLPDWASGHPSPPCG